MPTFESKFTDDQRQAIFELKHEGKSGAEVERICRGGCKGLEPFEVRAQTANRIYREELERRNEPSPLSKLPPSQAIAKLIEESIQFAERQIATLRRRGKREDVGAEFKRYVDALEKLQRMTSQSGTVQSGTVHGGTEPSSLLAKLAEAE
jgi:hypothetical protein